MKAISPPLAWFRKFLAAAFGGAADGLLIGLGGAGAISVAAQQPVDVRAVGYMVIVNLLLDLARFVKLNPDPWEFPIPSVMPVIENPKPAV